MSQLLKVENLKTSFFTWDGEVKAVNGVNFSINEGESMGLVGESGCGKTMTALSIMGLVPQPGKIIGGKIWFKNKDLLMGENKVENMRGSEISMIFQDPLTSLNPVIRIGDQISEVYQIHQKLSKSDSMDKTLELMEMVGIASPASRANSYPHQFSGGMRQRIMIAMALAGNPSLLIADEPTTNLDVTIQVQILELMKSIKNQINMSILLITHNLGLVAWLCNRVSVMYAGNIVENADVKTIFKNPKHPYTQLLLKAIPSITEKIDRLQTIPGSVPNLIDIPAGCIFFTRCPYAMEICQKQDPEYVEVEKEHHAKCHLLK
jgi:oligopeptide/dipeptide ABC transporter ATP-binding protein